MDFARYSKRCRNLVDKALRSFLPSASTKPAILHRAMRYSLFGGGKRVRPILCLAACQAVGGSWRKVLKTACALELIHTYSLIHDDLPCMDDDALRRGRPTNHIVFGEGMAVLAGDALLTQAFDLLSNNKEVHPRVSLQIIRCITQAAGSRHLIGGQSEDLAAEGKRLSLSDLRWIHLHKTAALIQASVHSGALLGGANSVQQRRLVSYGRAIGLAFQVADDILDVVGEEKKMGKRVRKDAQKKKATYPAIAGLQASRDLLERLTQSALTQLKGFGPAADPLREMARYLASRQS